LKNLRKRLVETTLEVREEGEQPKISGYGIVYGQRTQIWEDLWEVIMPGAASHILNNSPDIRCAFNHSSDHIFGRTRSGTLELEEDEFGVRYTATPPDAQWCRDVMESIRRGDIDGSSFTFGVEPQHEQVTKQDDGTFLRQIFRLDVIGEMGPVSYPAYQGTSAHVRSAKEEYDSVTEALRAQEDSVKIAARQRALELRKRRIELLERITKPEKEMKP